MLGIQHHPARTCTTSSSARAGPERSRKRPGPSRSGSSSSVSVAAAGACRLARVGQQKLLAIARVLATEAEVLLLDEPASAIDFNWVDTVLDYIELLEEAGRTICLVEHSLHVVGRLADHVYFMELGKVTAEGDLAELTADTRLAESYFGTV